MKLGICLRKSAYLPEAFAYRDFFLVNGIEVELALEHEISNDVNVKYKFPSLLYPDKSLFTNHRVLEIHEYSSLSVPPFSKVKDYLKSTFNPKPLGRVFLNQVVKDGFMFNDGTPFIFRDMGIDRLFFKVNNLVIKYDIIYCGAEHKGLHLVIQRLIKMNFYILIVGDFSKSFRSHFSNEKLVFFSGRVGRSELPELYKSCRFGLNYTPDVFPFNVQTSTKTLEYCASGLGIISNRYQWVENLAASRKGKFLWLDNLKTREDAECFPFQIPNVSDLEWSLVLERSNIVPFILSL